MTIYSFHLFDRHCEQIFCRIWKQGNNTIHPPDLAKLIFGITYSLRNSIRKLSPETSEEQGYFNFATDSYALHFLETTTLLRFVILSSPPAPVPQATVLHPNPNQPVDLNYEVILRQIYERLYVEYIVKNPLSLAQLYEDQQRKTYMESRFGRDGDRTKQQTKKKKEIELREGSVDGAMHGIGMVQGCDLFSLALDTFLRSIDS